MQEDESTYPFWLGEAAEGGARRVGVSESWLEANGIGAVVGLDLAPSGSALQRGDALGILHTSLGAHDLRAPMAMTLVRLNPEVLANPALARLSPYGRGWLAEARLG